MRSVKDGEKESDSIRLHVEGLHTYILAVEMSSESQNDLSR